MATGTVKWFNNAKGYGFVLPEGGGDDLFVHYSSIQMDGYKSLKAGQAVEYDIQAGPKGMHAVNIRAGAQSEEATEPLVGSAGAIRQEGAWQSDMQPEAAMEFEEG